MIPAAGHPFAKQTRGGLCRPTKFIEPEPTTIQSRLAGRQSLAQRFNGGKARFIDWESRQGRQMPPRASARVSAFFLFRDNRVTFVISPCTFPLEFPSPDPILIE